MVRLQKQIEDTDKAILHKKNKGISFVYKNGSYLEYVNIPSNNYQQFNYVAAKTKKHKRITN